MAASDLLLKDQSATPAGFAPESTDQGTNTAGVTIKRSMFGAKDGALATLGSTTDAPWDGAAASPTEMAILKAFAAVILGVSGKTVPVSAANLPLPAGAATDANLVAILNALKAQIDIAPLFVTDGTHYYVRREQVNEGTQAITVVFENIDGTAATPASVSALTPIVASGSSGGTASTRYVEQTLFDVTTGATGYAVGDVIARAVFSDTSTSSVVASAWLNLTQGTTLSGAPTAANLREQTQNTIITQSALPTGAATEATLGLIRALLAGTLAMRGTAGLGALAAVPGFSANGTALGTMPAGAQGARLYLPTGASITFAVASTAPSSAPTTFTVSASTTGPNWDENLSGGQMIYITAVTGSPLFRWY